MSNPILTVFDDAGNAIAIPAFPWVTEGVGGGGDLGWIRVCELEIPAPPVSITVTAE